MKRLSLLISGIFLTTLPSVVFASSAAVYCPQQIVCTSSSLSSCKVSDPNWQISSESSRITHRGTYVFSRAVTFPQGYHYTFGFKAQCGYFLEGSADHMALIVLSHSGQSSGADNYYADSKSGNWELSDGMAWCQGNSRYICKMIRK